MEGEALFQDTVVTSSGGGEPGQLPGTAQVETQTALLPPLADLLRHIEAVVATEPDT
jgi:hypothetical protein